jgi:hypothetical protein
MSARTSRQIRVLRALGVAFLAIGCGAVVTTTAEAQESVIIVGGDLTVLGQRGSAVPVWSLVGSGISVVAGGGDTGNTGGQDCFPCVPGRTISMLGIFGGMTLGSGSAVVNGALYRPVFFAGVLNFHAHAAVMPDFDGNSWRNVTVPFNLGTDSFLMGYADSNRTQLLFTIGPLIGMGTATLHLLQHIDPTFSFYSWRSTTYTFGPGVNLLEKSGFEEYTPPALGVPGWVSDPNRQTPAYSETNQPYSGANNGACLTQGSLDCGIYQEVTATSTGTYLLTFYATADRDGGLVGANVNGDLAVSSPVEARGFRNYGAPYTMTFQATAGDTIRVWMYSPPLPGYVVVDDVSLIGPQ